MLYTLREIKPVFCQINFLRNSITLSHFRALCTQSFFCQQNIYIQIKSVLHKKTHFSLNPHYTFMDQLLP